MKQWENKRSVEKEELSILKHITNRLDEPKTPPPENPTFDTNCDQYILFGELITEKMRKLSEDAHIKAEIAISPALAGQQLRDIRRRRMPPPSSHMDNPMAFAHSPQYSSPFRPNSMPPTYAQSSGFNGRMSVDTHFEINKDFEPGMLSPIGAAKKSSKELN